MLKYNAIELLTSETARCRNKPLADAVLQYVSKLKIAARCMVTRGIAGCYENGELATGRLEILSMNMPIRVSIVLPSRETERVVKDLNEMVGDGLLMVHDLHVVSHKARNSFFPPQLTVRDVMTPDPARVEPDTSLRDVVRLLLPSIFTGVPVVDAGHRPVGVVTQGDLIRKGGLPLRLGLLAKSDGSRLDRVLERLASRKAMEVMTAPAVLIEENLLLTEAVALMLSKKVKRLPVVDEKGRLSGMLSRLDVFQTVMQKAPDWSAFRAQQVEVDQIRTVRDILRRDTHTASPETAIEEVIRQIDSNDIQRVAVVDPEGKLLGIISDSDLLHFFRSKQPDIWRGLSKVKHLFKPDENRTSKQNGFSEETAGSVMNKVFVTVGEEVTIESAIALMIEKGCKRLPVVDDAGRFKGMISRASLLRIGYGDRTHSRC